MQRHLDSLLHPLCRGNNWIRLRRVYEARAVAFTLQKYYASLHAHQTTAPMQGEMLNFDELNAVIGTPELMALGQRY
jgi:hypothetical protein